MFHVLFVPTIHLGPPMNIFAFSIDLRKIIIRPLCHEIMREGVQECVSCAYLRFCSHWKGTEHTWATGCSMLVNNSCWWAHRETLPHPYSRVALHITIRFLLNCERASHLVYENNYMLIVGSIPWSPPFRLLRVYGNRKRTPFTPATKWSIVSSFQKLTNWALFI